MNLLIALVVGYISIVISDYIVHRKVLHGKYFFVKSPNRFFRMWLYPHYISHFKVHHSHSFTAKAELQKGLPVPSSLKEKKEEQYRELLWTRLGLFCSDHGMTIKDASCLVSFLSLFVLTPHYFVAIGLGMLLGPQAGLLVLLLTLLPAYNHLHHRFYHMEKGARRDLAPWYLRWFILSGEVHKISIEHHAHHHERAGIDDFYNLLPFGRYILRPVFGRH